MVFAWQGHHISCAQCCTKEIILITKLGVLVVNKVFYRFIVPCHTYVLKQSAYYNCVRILISWPSLWIFLCHCGFRISASVLVSTDRGSFRHGPRRRLSLDVRPPTLPHKNSLLSRRLEKRWFIFLDSNQQCMHFCFEASITDSRLVEFQKKKCFLSIKIVPLK